MGRKRLKSLRSDILLDRKVVASGTQILPHRHHPHSPLIYVLHHCSDFLNLLTQADHQSGLADYPSLACRPPEHTQGPLVIQRSLSVLGWAASQGGVVSKTGLMVGLGEEIEEVRAVMQDVYLSLIHISEPTRRTPIS